MQNGHKLARKHLRVLFHILRNIKHIVSEERAGFSKDRSRAGSRGHNAISSVALALEYSSNIALVIATLLLVNPCVLHILSHGDTTASFNGCLAGYCYLVIPRDGPHLDRK